jgi:diguanylate cyclase (GGDEF)-like protein/PAS domain S-box-containing protein
VHRNIGANEYVSHRTEWRWGLWSTGFVKSIRPDKRATLVRILLVDDDGTAAAAVEAARGQLKACLFQVEHVRRCSAGLERLSQERLRGAAPADPIAVVVFALGLPDDAGLNGVRRCMAMAPGVPLLVLAHAAQEEIARQAMQLGAQDYLLRERLDGYALLKALRGIVDRALVARTLFQERDVAQATLNSIGDAVLSTDLACRVTFLNGVAERLTGWSSRDAVGRPIEEVFQPLDAITRQPAPNVMALAIGRDQTTFLPKDCILIQRGGQIHAIEDSAAPIHDQDGRLTGAVLVFRDVSVARALAHRLAYSAGHDELTDLPNRMLFNDRLAQALALARRNNRQIALLFLDVDGFKPVNDSFGHAVGDRLLQSVAHRLRGCVRSTDTVGRQGGDEFLVLLSDITSADAVELIADKLLLAFALPHRIGAHTLKIGASIGIAIYPTDGADEESLLRHADTAMYQVKYGGGNRYEFCTSEHIAECRG